MKEESEFLTDFNLASCHTSENLFSISNITIELSVNISPLVSSKWVNCREYGKKIQCFTHVISKFEKQNLWVEDLRSKTSLNVVPKGNCFGENTQPDCKSCQNLLPRGKIFTATISSKY